MLDGMSPPDSATDEMPGAENAISTHLDDFQYKDNTNDDKLSYDDDRDDYESNDGSDNIASLSKSDKSSSPSETEKTNEAAEAFSDSFNQRKSSSSTETPSFGSISLVERWDDKDETSNNIDAKQSSHEIYGTEIDHEQRGNLWSKNLHKSGFIKLLLFVSLSLSYLTSVPFDNFIF